MLLQKSIIHIVDGVGNGHLASSTQLILPIPDIFGGESNLGMLDCVKSRWDILYLHLSFLVGLQSDVMRFYHKLVGIGV